MVLTRLSFGKLIRDPLSHFLGIGMVLLALSFWLGGPAEDPSRVIHISAGDVERIKQRWSKTHFRPPTEAELKGLIASRIKEEILYREALALGLSEDDTIIRRRLAQKMEFLGEGLIDPGEPSEADLHTYLKAHSEQFQEPARISFDHVYLNPERRGEATEQDAEALLVSFQARDGAVDAHHAGDPILLDTRFDLASQTSIANSFGNAFAQAMMDLSPGRWQGPVRSAYGLHVVYVHERQEGRLPALNTVRDRVRLALLSERRRDSKDTFYETLRDHYEIVVERPTPDESQPLAQAQ